VKRRFFAVLLLVFFLFLPLTAAAANDLLLNVQLEGLQAEEIARALPSEARGALRDVSFAAPDLQAGLVSIVKNIRTKDAGGTMVALGLKILAMVFLCGICNEFIENGRKVTNIACVLLVAILATSDVRGVMALSVKTINQMLLLSKTLFPILATSAAASGMPVQGAAKCAVTVMSIDLLMELMSKCLIPLIYAHIVLTLAHGITGNPLFSKISELVSGFVTGVLKLSVTLFLAYISISSAVAAGADSLTKRTARFAISSGVPVVGSALSDGSEAILSSANLIKNSLGVYGLLSILAILVTPLVLIGIRFVAFKLLSGVSGTVAEDSVIKLLDGLSKAYGMIFGLAVAIGVMLLISITQIIMMNGGG